MTAQSGIRFVLADSNRTAPRRRTGLFWLTNLLVFAAFFLAVHELDASQHWLKTARGEISAVKDAESSGRSTRQIGFLILGAAGVILLARPSATKSHPSPLLLFPLVMLLLWITTSVVWSADWALTLKRQVVLLCMLLAVAGIIRQFTLTQLAEMMLVQSLLVIILGVVVEAILHPVLPVSDGEYRFAGTLHPNHMGINATLLLLSSLFFARYRANPRFFLLTIIAIITLMMSKSRTALFSAIVGSVVFVVLAYPKKRFVLALTFCIAGGIAMAVIATDVFSDLGHAVLMNRGTSDPTTLTGRTMIWQFALDRVRDDWGRIFTGFGYGGFWTPETAQALSQRAQFSLSEGHNGYLDTMLQLGIPGLALYLWCIIGALIAWIVTARRSVLPQAALAAGLICFALNHHFAESALTAPSFPTLMLWSVIGFAALRNESTTSTPVLRYAEEPDSSMFLPRRGSH